MDRTIGTPGGNRPDLARFDPPSRNEAEGGHVDLDRRSLMPGEPAGLELTRFRGHFSILALKEVHDAPPDVAWLFVAGSHGRAARYESQTQRYAEGAHHGLDSTE